MKTKTCPTCKKVLLISAYNKNRAKPDGVQSSCRECQKSNEKKDYHSNPTRRRKLREAANQRLDRNRNHVWEYLLKHPCIDCDEDDPIVLDFDHFTTKKYHISDLVRSGVSLNKIDNEIAKCNVRCANCHRRKTAKEKGYYKYRDKV